MGANSKALRDLAHLFKIAGASDPEAWARSELEEGIPQLSRFLFLRQAWREVIKDGDSSWIDTEIASARQAPNDPGSGIGPALERLVAGGALRDDISKVARIMQWQLLSRMCYLLSDPSIEERELQGTGWCLFEVDESGNAGRPIDGLHESVLETDPTGREMRP